MHSCDDRAREAYDNPVPPTNEVESISYRKLLQAMHPPLTPYTVRSVLGHRKLLYALGSLIIKCNHLFAMRALLLCVYTICCSEGQEATLTMVVADSSRVLARVSAMLHL